MTQTENDIPENDIKRYLFAEMEPDERDAYDEQLFLDDELFFEVADVENRLVDAYVHEQLTGDDLVRFERSLVSVPGRREKIENARSLGEFIVEARPAPAAVAEVEKVSLWQRLMGNIGGRSPVFAGAMAVMLIALMISTGVLIFQNREQSDRVARLQNLQSAKEAELQNELDISRQREAELQETSSDFAEDLERERSRREEIERELEKYRNANPPTPSAPLIATVLLLPGGGRGGPGGNMPDVNLGPETRQLSMRLALPADIQKDDRLNVELNQKTVARNVAPRITGASGSINVTVSSQTLSKGKNQLEVTDTQGRSVGSYSFNAVTR